VSSTADRERPDSLDSVEELSGARARGTHDAIELALIVNSAARAICADRPFKRGLLPS
jgi:hypothetical protein